jgi:hypothetical protein
MGSFQTRNASPIAGQWGIAEAYQVNLTACGTLRLRNDACAKRRQCPYRIRVNNGGIGGRGYVAVFIRVWAIILDS